MAFELSRPTTRWPALSNASVRGMPLPQPMSRTQDPGTIDDARAVTSATPVSSTRSDAYQSAIRSYSRISNPSGRLPALSRLGDGEDGTQVSSEPALHRDGQEKSPAEAGLGL